VDGEGSTTPASDANQDSTGTSGDGGAGDGAGSTTPTVDAFADERNKLTQQIRDFQSRADRLQAELDKAKAVSAPEPASTQPEALTAEGVMALLRRDRELTSAVSQLRNDFPFADDAIFTGYERFDSVEAFRAEAEASHTRIKALAEKAAQPLVDAALAPYVEKYGRLNTTPADNGGASATGLPSLEEVRGYNATQLQTLVDQHGEDVIERIWRSATISQ
jgi:hypothetical protein